MVSNFLDVVRTPSHWWPNTHLRSTTRTQRRYAAIGAMVGVINMTLMLTLITYPRAPLFSSLNSCCPIPGPHIPHMGISRLSDPMDRASSGSTRFSRRHDHHQRRLLFLLGDISSIAGGTHYRVSRPSGDHHTDRTSSECSFSVVSRSLHPSSRIHTASHGDVVKRRSINRHGEAEVHPLRNCTGNA